MPEKRGKPKKPPPQRNGPLRIDLEFDDALRAAMKTPPPKTPAKRKKHRSGT